MSSISYNDQDQFVAATKPNWLALARSITEVRPDRTQSLYADTPVRAANKTSRRANVAGLVVDVGLLILAFTCVAGVGALIGLTYAAS